MSLTQEQLKARVKYDLDTGIFTWAITGGARSKQGDIAGCFNNKGYWCIRIGDKAYKAHRLAFLYVLGKFPEKQVDHIDGNKANNSWCNLRECTNSQNQMNTGISKRNSSLDKGIFKNPCGKYRVQLGINNKKCYLGLFTDLEEARKVVREFREQLHGEFANHG